MDIYAFMLERHGRAVYDACCGMVRDGIDAPTFKRIIREQSRKAVEVMHKDAGILLPTGDR